MNSPIAPPAPYPPGYDWGMMGPGRRFWKIEILLAVIFAVALLAIYCLPAFNLISIPVGLASFAGFWIIGRLNDDPPDY